MKRCLWAILLAMLLVIGLMPAALAANTPGLYWRYASWDENGNPFEDLNKTLQSAFNYEIGYTCYLKFYFFDGKDEYSVPLSELNLPSILTAQPEDGTDFFHLGGIAVGDDYITYERDGATYSLPVSIVLRRFGCYSTPNATSADFISKFKWTEQNNCFYFVSSDNSVLTDVRVVGAYADYATTEKIDDKCWKITVSEVVDDDRLEIRYDGTYEWGVSFYDESDDIRVSDATPGLRIRHAYWDMNDNLCEDLRDPLQSILNCEMDHGYSVKFYFFDGENEYYVPFSEVNLPSILTARPEDGTEFVRLEGTGFGDGSITYERDGKTYSLPVSVTPPDFGFYSTPDATPANYINEFTITAENNVFYFVTTRVGAFTAFELIDGLENIATFEQISDICVKITVTGKVESGHWYGVHFDFAYADGGNTDFRMGLWLIDATPGLYYRYMSHDGNGWYEDLNNQLESALDIGIGYSAPVMFYFVDGGNEYFVPFSEVNLPYFLTTQGDQTTDGTDFFHLTGVDFGDGYITYERDGATYSLPVTVYLPEYAFYSSTTPSIPTYLSQFTLTEQNNVLYFVGRDGATLTSVWVEGAYADIAQLEKISDSCWKVTLPYIAPGDDDALQLIYSGTNVGGYEFTDWGYGLQIIDGMPGLRYRYINSYENGYYEDMDRPLQNAWTATYNNSTRVKFYFFDGVDTFPLTINDLIIPSGITVNDLGNNFYRLRPTSFASMSIDYVRDGVTYSLPVTVYLPEYAFYSSTTPSIPTYLSQFTLTEQNNVLYFVGRDGGTISSVTVTGAYADIAQLEQISESCWKITLSHIAPGNDDALQLSYSGTNMNGHEFTDWGYGLQIIDGMPGLRLRHMWWDNSTQQYYEDPSASLQKSWNTSINSGSCVKFYFFDGQNEIPVSLSELTWSNCVTIEAVENQPYYHLRSIAFGNGTISYVRGGKTYTLPVSVGLPDFGFYSSEIPSEATYLSEFRMTADSKTFYFVAINDHTLTSVTAEYDYLQMEKISDSCWKITVTGPVSNSYFRLNYSGIFRWGETFTNYGYGFEIIDSTPGLRIRQMRWDPDAQEYYEDLSRPLQSAWSEWIGYSNPVKFYFFDGKNEFPVMLEELIVPDFIEIELMYNGAFYDIGGNTFGDGVISYVRDGVTYTLPVSVTLPGYGFYSSETPSIETYISEFAPSEDNKSFYFVSRNEGSFTYFALTNGLENIATFEHISDTCIKITVTGNYQVDRWYSVSYRFEGPGVTSSGSTGLRFVDTTPGLRFRQMRWDPDAQEYYEDLSRPLQNAWNTVIDGWSGVKFYFFDGKNEIPVTPDELTIPDCIEVFTIDDGAYYELHAKSFGSGTITYVRDGVTYSLPVSVELPFIGFYSSQTPSAETYINEFAPTADNNSFYLVTIGRTLNYVEITNVYANLAQVEQISDTCWKITVNMLSNVEHMEIYFEDEYGYGTRSIEIVDRTPGLKLRYMTWSADGMYEDLTTPLISSWDGRMNTFSYVKFYFFDGENEFPVSPDELIIPGCVGIWSDDQTDYHELYAIRLGRGAIRYERDGVTYELPVTVDLPNFGFYTSTTSAWNTYISSAFSVTEESNSVYFIALNGFKMSDFELPEEMAAFTTIKRISDTCWKFTFSDGFEPQKYYRFTYSVTNTWGNTNQWSNGITLHKPEPVASGDCGADGSSVTWSLTDDGVLTISGDGAMANYAAGAGTLSVTRGQEASILSQRNATTAPWLEYSHLITKVVIKDGVTSIGDNAFADCAQLTDITIPETVTTIGENVSTGCEALTTITFTGSEEQWAEIEIATGNEVLEETEVFTENVLLGDVNDDGQINGTDTNLIFRYVSGTLSFDDAQLAAADVNCDGQVNGTDTNLVFRFVSGTLESFE